MKKYYPLIFLFFLFLTQTVFAQDIYNVVFMVAPFAGKVNGAPMPDYKYGRMVSGDQITLDLGGSDHSGSAGHGCHSHRRGIWAAFGFQI